MHFMTVVGLVGLVCCLGSAEWARRRCRRVLVVLWVAVAGVLAYLVGGWWLTGPLGGVLGWLVWVRWRYPGARSRVARGRRSSRRNEGLASRWQLLRHASPWAMRRQSTTVRPTFGALAWRERWRVPVTEYALPVTRVGWVRMWVSIEEMVIQFGRPRRGKTGQLIHWLVDAPGAVIATSTKVDVYYLTRWLRARQGDVYIFNPTGIGDLPSTVAFDPLVECADPERAEERAIDLISGGVSRSEGEGQRWDAQGQRVLTALLHAAAIGGHSLLDVLAWVANPDAATPRVMSLLRRSPAASAFVPAAEQFFTTNSRTRSSVTFTIMPALAWLGNSRAVAATRGTVRFDVARLLEGRATLYLLAAGTRMGPLMSALTGYLAREAKRIAASRPGGRLDPPLRLILDEAANTCPVPLDEWSSDFGSHGIQICAAFQSYQQMIGRWGTAGAGAIVNNAAVMVVHATGYHVPDLERFVALSGHRVDEAGRRVPVLAIDQLMTLPKGTTVVWGPDTPVTIGRMRPAWQRRDVRRALKAEGLAPQQFVAAMEDTLTEAAEHPTERAVLAGDR